MWYVANILFAQRTEGDQSEVLCEDCDVLFEAETAVEAYGKASTWADEYTREGAFEFLGVLNVYNLDDERPGDGVEVGGRFFYDRDPWGTRAVPDMNEIMTIRGEAEPDATVGELASDETIRNMKRIFGGE